MTYRLFLVALVSICVGCASPGYFGRGHVAAELACRTGHDLGSPDPCQPEIPAGLNEEDGLSEDEAVAVALWNNPAYQELLTEIGVSRANVIQANLLTNPTLRVLVRNDPLPTQLFLTAPLEALWLRGRRVRAAQNESEQVAERLVQNGLDVVRDVRVAYANVVLAQDRVRLTDEATELRQRIAQIAEARLKAGDASDLEAATARIDALRAKQDARRLKYDVELATEALRNTMGLALAPTSLACREPAELLSLETDPETLVAEAIQTRPDLLAVEHSVDAAATRARLARTDYLRVAAVLQADGTGPGGTTRVGPDVTIPLFDQNQGAIARAEATLERANRRYVTLRDQIALEVRQAHIRLTQADRDLATWRTEILPALDRTVNQAERSFQEGDTNLLLMLEAARRLVEAQIREAEVLADLRRARAELERSVGRRLFEEAESLPPGVERKL